MYTAKHGCTSNYKAVTSLIFVFFYTQKVCKPHVGSCNEHIFGYQIRTVNMDRYHGSQISRALDVLDLVNEKKYWLMESSD